MQEKWARKRVSDATGPVFGRKAAKLRVNIDFGQPMLARVAYAHTDFQGSWAQTAGLPLFRRCPRCTNLVGNRAVLQPLHNQKKKETFAEVGGKLESIRSCIMFQELGGFPFPRKQRLDNC